jgi:hypothetical protein
MSSSTFFDPKKPPKKAKGRVNASKLFGVNPFATRDALKEKHYWELYKQSHPINRWQYRRWEERLRKESLFVDRINSLPIDQRYKLKKELLTPNNVALMVPVGMTFYLVYCFVRYKVWGITPAEAGVSTARYVQLGPRPPDL